MKKTIFIAVLAILFTTNMAVSQRIRNEKQKFQYIRLPLEPLPSNVKTYRVSAVVPESLGNEKQYLETQIARAVKLDGYQVNEQSPDLDVMVRLQPFYATNRLAEEVVEEKRGDVTVKVNYYYYTIDYYYPVEVMIDDKANAKSLYNDFINNSKNYSNSNTTKFKSTSELNAWWKNSKQTTINDLKTKLLEAHLSALNSMVKSKYDFAVITEIEEIYAPIAKKEDYSDLDTTQNRAVRAYRTIKADRTTGFDEFKTKIAEPIEMWKNILKEANPKDKKARIDAKVANIIHYNIAKAYCWMNDFQQARYHIEQAKINDKNDYWTIDLGKIIDDREARLKANESKL